MRISKVTLAALASMVVGVTAANAAPLYPKAGLQGRHCFHAVPAIGKATLLQLELKRFGNGVSVGAGVGYEADGAPPDRVVAVKGSLRRDTTSGLERILGNLDIAYTKTDATDPLGFKGLNVMEHVYVRLDPLTLNGVFEGIETVGIFDTALDANGLPLIDPRDCGAPATCNGLVVQQNNAGKVTYLGKGACPAVPFVLP